ncbi:MAG TPA: hypothetical protein PK079_26750 [Leptospiraceae bacterium]|nr:hypothetical protein [Leptospiraceae bacterium]HMW08160.1 hypothetical protein [Leptospiraceae bacterium]HMX32940.1 hypothetical protein [Leptospiraceae bacterium]HMY33963.1 hypothetical protein [Leptospiraceae bacterium]HMZ65678.1 hypothetical protein [Leptospiraceae bacterium]
MALKYVEERLNDYFAGRANRYLEQMNSQDKQSNPKQRTAV